MIPIAYTRRIDRPHPAMILCAPRELSLATEVAMERWNLKQETTRQEEFLLKRLQRTRKLFGRPHGRPHGTAPRVIECGRFCRA